MAEEGSASLEVGLPVLAVDIFRRKEGDVVMIGVDPAMHSHAMAVLDGSERQLAALQVANENDGYQGMLRLARRWPQRTNARASTREATNHRPRPS